MKFHLLILSTYPFNKPQHGGQIRLSNISKAYMRAGWEVDFLVLGDLEDSAGKKAIESNCITLNRKSPHAWWEGKFIPWLADFLAGEYACHDTAVWADVSRKLPKKIDVISVEHPWLWSLAKHIQGLPQFQHVKLIYSSHNVETVMKAESLASFDIPKLPLLMQCIEKVERNAVLEADLVTVVSQSDFDAFSHWGAKKILLAENGISPWNTSVSQKNAWSKKLPRGKWPLYVSSAHPPNFLGFAQALGWNLGAIPPDSRLVLAGGAASFIERQFIPSLTRPEAAIEQVNQVRFATLNESRIRCLGVLPEADLNAVKSLASAFVLPIASGGGTNIKTAEALMSGACVIGTPLAFRGYESFMDFPTVRIANTPQQFSNALRDILAPSQITPNLNADQLRVLDGLNWECRLETIPKHAQTLLTN